MTIEIKKRECGERFGQDMKKGDTFVNEGGFHCIAIETFGGPNTGRESMAVYEIPCMTKRSVLRTESVQLTKVTAEYEVIQ